MPHRVTEFFRSHSFEGAAADSKRAADLKRVSQRSSKNRTPPYNRSPSTASESSPLSSVEDFSTMPESHKRLSLTGLHSPRSSSRSIPQQQSHGSLDVKIESPPLVYYGAAASSTGALLSGQITFTVAEESVTVETFKMRLALESTHKKPFHAHCQECSQQSKDLTSWNFLQGPATLRKGEHSFPFSFLLPGGLPASMKGSLSTIDYVLRATLSPKTGEPMKYSRVLDVKRAVHPGDNPRNSIRIFPPTNLTATCTLPPVIYPIGETMLSMRMDGIVKRNEDGKTQTQWKLKRITWRLDETQKVVAPACAKHAAKLGAVDEAKKSVAHQDVRTVGTDELKSGWKADYSTADGSIELEFPFGIQGNSICDLKSPEGIEVAHVLIVEMIVAEEFAPIKKPHQVTPTGAARVLRMHFNVVVTERAGLGISWDEEQPPLYENVPASPPAYGKTENYEGEPIPDYEDLTPLDNGEGSSRTPTLNSHRSSLDHST